MLVTVFPREIERIPGDRSLIKATAEKSPRQWWFLNSSRVLYHHRIMIYLIGGAPRTGKSNISNLLMRELSVPWLSTDVLRTVIHDVTPPEEQAAKFPYGGITSADQLTEMQVKQMVDWQITETNSLQTCIDSLIRHQIGVRDSQTLEGVHILPRHVRALVDDPTCRDQIRVVFIVSEDESTQLEAMRKNNSHFDWLTGASDKAYASVAAFVVAYGKWIRGECEKYGISYVVRKGEFDSENNEILKILIS